jgi:hypothetical protein
VAAAAVVVVLVVGAAEEEEVAAEEDKDASKPLMYTKGSKGRWERRREF